MTAGVYLSQIKWFHMPPEVSDLIEIFLRFKVILKEFEDPLKP
jgi:hypothetical protein